DGGARRADRGVNTVVLFPLWRRHFNMNSAEDTVGETTDCEADRLHSFGPVRNASEREIRGDPLPPLRVDKVITDGAGTKIAEQKRHGLSEVRNERRDLFFVDEVEAHICAFRFEGEERWLAFDRFEYSMLLQLRDGVRRKRGGVPERVLKCGL